MIYIIGLGPGEKEQMTYKAIDAIKNSDIIAGYTVYIDLIKLCEYDNQQGKQIVLQGILKRYVAGYSNG